MTLMPSPFPPATIIKPWFRIIRVSSIGDGITQANVDRGHPVILILDEKVNINPMYAKYCRLSDSFILVCPNQNFVISKFKDQLWI